ncbi:MAG: molybdopterin molybdotransferase MoeA [Syntrophobacterales bacterium]|jgi:molybdopterin molybdotransferase|nr:molybdopterin molybdotransferase MoeA [Syntrophobacterales bacterium]
MEFLKSINSTEALGMIGSFAVSPKTEAVLIEEACGRVLAEDIVSREDIPQFPRSLVDGYAVMAKETYGAKETSPALLAVTGEIKIGEETDLSLAEGSSIYVSTGSMVPGGADGVVMQEFVRKMDDAVEVTKGVFRGENICFKGEDIHNGAVVLTSGTRLGPFHTGILAALGISRVPVFVKPSVSIISSGDEIVDINVMPPPGKIRDINRYTLTGLLGRRGAAVTFQGIAADNMKDIASMLRLSKDSDLILVSAGSSKGARDFVVAAVEAIGGSILFHGVNIKPGKPTIFGEFEGKSLFGLPGHPASCVLATVRFVLPLLARLAGERDYRPLTANARLSTNIPSSYGIEEFVRVRLENTEGRLEAAPVFSKSAVISSLAMASGYVIVPDGREGLETGEEVKVYLFD